MWGSARERDITRSYNRPHPSSPWMMGSGLEGSSLKLMGQVVTIILDDGAKKVGTVYA